MGLPLGSTDRGTEESRLAPPGRSGHRPLPWTRAWPGFTLQPSHHLSGLGLVHSSLSCARPATRAGSPRASTRRLVSARHRPPVTRPSQSPGARRPLPGVCRALRQWHGPAPPATGAGGDERGSRVAATLTRHAAESDSGASRRRPELWHFRRTLGQPGSARDADGPRGRWCGRCDGELGE